MQITQLTLASFHPTFLADYYETIFGLAVSRKDSEIEIVMGSTKIVFKKANTAAKPFYHIAFTIPSNKIEEAKIWLGDKVDLLWIDEFNSDIAEFVNWNARSVYFFDNGGNLLELIARKDLDNTTTQTFSPADFLSVSEIGIVFPKHEMEKRTQDLLGDYHLSYFNKQPPMSNFKAVGDDEGLFIIVPEGRNWYPTQDLPAGIFPLHVVFRQEGKLYSYGNLDGFNS